MTANRTSTATTPAKTTFHLDNVTLMAVDDNRGEERFKPRVHAHILVTFLAYAMWKTLQKWMEQWNRLGAWPDTTGKGVTA